MITFIVIVFTLSILVLAHEFGHFIVARLLGVRVEEFGFGFPPRIFGLQRFRFQRQKKKDTTTESSGTAVKETISDTVTTHGSTQTKAEWRIFQGSKPISGAAEPSTIYSLNAIPLGGFVKLKGEDSASEDSASSKDLDSFPNQKIWKKISIVIAGVAMNIVLCVIVLSVGFITGLPSTKDSLPIGARVRDIHIQVLYVDPSSSAQNAGIKVGDTIESMNGVQYSSLDSFLNAKKTEADKDISLGIVRERKNINIPVHVSSDGLLGVQLSEIGLVSYPFFQAIWQGIKSTGFITYQIFASFWMIIKDLVTEKKMIGSVSGPVGIAVMAGQVWKMGLPYVLQFIAILSVNLAVLNLLPWPALDGGRIVFFILEKIRRKPINQRIESAVHNTGFLILIGLVIVITCKDLIQFFQSIRHWFY